MFRLPPLGAACAAALCCTTFVTAAPSTAFNYRGQLVQGGVPVTDVCEITFTLWNDVAAGAPVGAPVILSNVDIEDGEFDVVLDFGAPALVGDGRWLEIAVECPGDVAPIVLSPRQALRPTSYSVFSQAASEEFNVYYGNEAMVRAFVELDDEEGDIVGEIEIKSDSGQVSYLAPDGMFLAMSHDEDAPEIVEIGAYEFGGRVGVNYSGGNAGASMLPGSVTVNASSGQQQAVLYSPNGTGEGTLLLYKADGSLGVTAGGGVLYAEELYASGTKNFRIPNPDDPATDIVYACPEGPEAAVYVRGTARLENGKATIKFPGYFKSIINAKGMTVTVTPRSADSRGLAVTERSRFGCVVRELQRGQGSYEFDYTVMAVRRGFEDFEVVRPARDRTGAASGAAQ